MDGSIIEKKVQREQKSQLCQLFHITKQFYSRVECRIGSNHRSTPVLTVGSLLNALQNQTEVNLIKNSITKVT